MLEEKDKSLLKLFGKKILARRMHKGMTQEEMAEKLGTLHNQISRLESGKVNPKATTLVKISEVLEISIDELFRLADD